MTAKDAGAGTTPARCRLLDLSTTITLDEPETVREPEFTNVKVTGEEIYIEGRVTLSEI